MRYTVTMRYQFPAWDEKDGIPFEIEADSRSLANRHARGEANRLDLIYRGKGRITFKAVEATPEA